MRTDHPLESLEKRREKEQAGSGVKAQGRKSILFAFPPPRDLPDPGIEHTSLSSAALAGGFFTTAPLSKE